MYVALGHIHLKLISIFIWKMKINKILNSQWRYLKWDFSLEKKKKEKLAAYNIQRTKCKDNKSKDLLMHFIVEVRCTSKFAVSSNLVLGSVCTSLKKVLCCFELKISRFWCLWTASTVADSSQKLKAPRSMLFSASEFL